MVPAIKSTTWMCWMNVFNEIKGNTKSAQTRSQVNVKYISVMNASSGPLEENHKPVHQG